MKESFSSITDTRQQSQVRHDLYEIIAMTIAAVIGNCDGWDEIEDFCRSKEEWLREHMGMELEHGIPSETTFARVWGQIDPEAFKRCFQQWTNQVHQKISGEIISIDGMTVCGSKSEEHRPIHMISAWVTEQELVLGQMCVEEKTNEIPTVPLLLDLLDVSGCIITADAMSCQREIARKITDGKSSLMIFDRHANLKYKYGNRHFWCRGYYVDMVGKYENAIKEYIKNQLQDDIMNDQISMKELIDPFTGEQEKKGK